MSFTTSSTYVYTYVAFALVYLLSSVAFVVRSFRVSAALSQARQAVAAGESRGADMASAEQYVGHGQRLIDFAQLATLLPLVYIVGSMFLGSMLLRDSDAAALLNTVWILLTVAAAAASVAFTVFGLREARRIDEYDENAIAASGGAVADALQRLGVRLGVSSALLVLVAVFTALNLWSVLANLDRITSIDYVL
ncbi:MAG: hypothetical protein QMC79_10155 [Anaerosomatales bacterium]|nr:hypothetical protein [Anaerosomatales bacterium]